MSKNRFLVQMVLKGWQYELTHTMLTDTMKEAEVKMIGMMSDYINATSHTIKYLRPDALENAIALQSGEALGIASIKDTLDPSGRIAATLDVGLFIRHHAEKPELTGKEYPCGCLRMFDRERGETWKKCEAFECSVFVPFPPFGKSVWMKPSRKMN